MLSKLTPDLTSPIVLFAYYNQIRARGLDVFCRDIKRAGVAGLLVPNLPLKLTHEVREACKKQGLELVLLVTSMTPNERMKEIAKCSQGFVYLVSVTRVTGVRSSLSSRLQGLVTELESSTDKSIAVGSGVSASDQARQLQEWGSDGVIVGAALVKALNEGGLPMMKEVTRSIKEAIA
eukprot:g7430.t1